MASAVWRTRSAVTPQPSWFQLFQPMGGVGAIPSASGTGKSSSTGAGFGLLGAPSDEHAATSGTLAIKAKKNVLVAMGPGPLFSSLHGDDRASLDRADETRAR